MQGNPLVCLKAFKNLFQNTINSLIIAKILLNSIFKETFRLFLNLHFQSTSPLEFSFIVKKTGTALLRHLTQEVLPDKCFKNCINLWLFSKTFGRFHLWALFSFQSWLILITLEKELERNGPLLCKFLSNIYSFHIFIDLLCFVWPSIKKKKSAWTF